jgi:hypothetical protein
MGWEMGRELWDGEKGGFLDFIIEIYAEDG